VAMHASSCCASWTTTYSIVLLDQTAPSLADRMRALLPSGFSLSYGTERGDEHMKLVIRDADFAISGQVGVSADVLRAARRLKLLHKWGVGVDNIDVATARELGIKVARTAGSNAVAVAECTIGLTIWTLRFLAFGHHNLKQGVWRGVATCRARRTCCPERLSALSASARSASSSRGC
jgi:D-3-phosphoglycerate dehydrogenase